MRDAQFGTLTGEMSTFTWPRILESRVNEELIRLLWPPEEIDEKIGVATFAELLHSFVIANIVCAFATHKRLAPSTEPQKNMLERRAWYSLVF